MIHDSSAMDRPVTRTPGLTRLLLLGLGVVLVAGAVWFYPSLRRWSQSEASVSIDRVRIGEVIRGDLVRDVAVEGRVVAAFNPTLFSPARGIVTVIARPGEVVVMEQPLAGVASPELQSRLRQEQSNLLSLQAELDRQRILSKQRRLEHDQAIELCEVELEAARRAMVRAEKSRALGIVNVVDYEKAQDEIRVSELRLTNARKMAALASDSLDFEITNRSSQLARQQAVLGDLQRQVAELTIRSPVSGLVARVHVEDRETVAANTALLTVVDLSAFEVEVAVAEVYSDEILPGTEAIVTAGGEIFKARVRSISPEVEGGRVQGFVDFGANMPAGLKQNQRVSVRLIIQTRANVIKVPRGPFLDANGGRQAYVIEGGLAVLRSIEVGSLSVAEVEVLSGLEPGEKIIISDTARFAGAGKILLR